MAIVNLKASIKAKAKVSASASVKTNFSGHHMFSAAYFARQSATIEQNYNNDSITDELRAQHKAYVNGAIICSVASLEATINEVFLYAVDNGNIFKNFDPLIPKLLAELWLIVEKAKASILQKYEIALTVTTKQKFNRGKTPYQDVDNLIRLRNALVHYKPEWDTD